MCSKLSAYSGRSGFASAQQFVLKINFLTFLFSLRQLGKKIISLKLAHLNWQTPLYNVFAISQFYTDCFFLIYDFLLNFRCQITDYKFRAL